MKTLPYSIYLRAIHVTRVVRLSLLRAPVSPLMAMSEEQILGYTGFDAVIFLRFYNLAFKVT